MLKHLSERKLFKSAQLTKEFELMKFDQVTQRRVDLVQKVNVRIELMQMIFV